MATLSRSASFGPAIGYAWPFGCKGDVNAYAGLNRSLSYVSSILAQCLIKLISTKKNFGNQCPGSAVSLQKDMVFIDVAESGQNEFTCLVGCHEFPKAPKAQH